MHKKDLRKALPLLKVLSGLEEHEFKQIIPFIDLSGCNAVFSCVENILFNKKIKCRRQLRDKLKKDKKHLRYIANSKRSPKRRKKRIEQVGGSIGLILGTVLPLLINFLRK